MQTKILVQGRYTVVSVLNGNVCPVEDSPFGTDANYRRHYAGLLDVLERVATDGLQQLPSSLSHFINKEPKIYEFIRGKLRLIYFHGTGDTVVVCTAIVVKKTQNADRKVVAKAIEVYKNYYRALTEGSLILIGEDDENQNE